LIVGKKEGENFEYSAWLIHEFSTILEVTEVSRLSGSSDHTYYEV
jgi:hypothetical protein